MKNIFFKAGFFVPIVIFFIFMGTVSCNKQPDAPQPILFEQSNKTIGDYITSDTSYSLFKEMATKVGVFALLNDKSQVYSVFAPNNNAMRNFAIPLTSAFIANANAATIAGLLTPIVKYAIIPGTILTQDLIPATFPNIQFPTTLSAGQLPGTILPFALTSFPSKRGSNFWYNSSPGISQLIANKNGVIQGISQVVVPPSKVIAELLYSDPNFSLFHAAINRGDSGQPAATKFDGAISNPGANLTLFAPTNTAVKQLISAMSGGAIPVAAPESVFINFINTFIPVQTARGLVAYHLMGVRAFSVNFPPSATFFPTLLNLAFATHPGVKVQSYFTGSSVDSIVVLGVGNGGAVAVSKPPINFDKNAVNGIIHVIDRVLLPQ